MAYTLTGRKSGTVRFVPFQTGIVESESETYTSTITSNPIESGSEINDHVNNAMGQLSIGGTIVGGDSAKAALIAMRNNRDIITYTGVSRMSNLVFTSLKFDRSYKNRNGATFSATLKQIQITSPAFVSMDGTVSMADQDSGNSSDAQLASTSNTGLTTVAVESVSSTCIERYDAAYSGDSSSAPTTRTTAAYDGT